MRESRRRCCRSPQRNKAHRPLRRRDAAVVREPSGKLEVRRDWESKQTLVPPRASLIHVSAARAEMQLGYTSEGQARAESPPSGAQSEPRANDAPRMLARLRADSEQRLLVLALPERSADKLPRRHRHGISTQIKASARTSTQKRARLLRARAAVSLLVFPPRRAKQARQTRFRLDHKS